MQKKISTTFWFTVAIAIVALLACTEVVYTEVGAKDDPKVFSNKFGNSEITVELYAGDKVKVLDTQTMEPFEPNVQLFICEGKDEKIDPERCYRAIFLNPRGCFILGNPTYYGHGGDGYRRP
jgi:hypothetical protein